MAAGAARASRSSRRRSWRSMPTPARSAWVYPDRASRSLGHGRSGAAEPGRPDHRRRRRFRRWSRRPSRARSSCSTAETGEPVLPVDRRARADRRGGGRFHGADPAGLGALLQAAEPLTEKDMWGATPFDQLACRIAFHQLRLRGPLHAAFGEGRDRLSRQFRHLQLGRRGGRSGAAGHVRHAGLSRLHLEAGARARTTPSAS